LILGHLPFHRISVHLLSARIADGIPFRASLIALPRKPAPRLERPIVDPNGLATRKLPLQMVGKTRCLKRVADEIGRELAAHGRRRRIDKWEHATRNVAGVSQVR